MSGNYSANNGFGYKLKKVFDFITMLNVEVLMFFIMMTYTLKKIPMDQMVQDKICLQRYNMTSDYCYELPKLKEKDDHLGKKSLILADMTTYQIYMSCAYTFPAVFASLFFGSWTDKYDKAKKMLMLAGALSFVLENLVLVLNAYYFNKSEMLALFSLLPSLCTGGLLAILTAIYSYISSTTPPGMRAMRMMVAEVVINVAQPIGTYIGGYVLNTKPILKDGQLHNYTSVFTIGACANFIGFLWVLFRVNELRDIRVFRKKFPSQEEGSALSKGEADQQKYYDDHKHIHPLKLLFNWGNIKDIWNTCVKPREDYIRLQIWLLFLAMVCFIMTHVGPIIFLYTFVQKVYQWDSETYSNWSAITRVVAALSTITITPILIKVLKAKDTTLAIIGLISYMSQNIILGVWLNPTGFYVSTATGALGAIGAVGIRTHFSKIVEPKELGKVFSLLSAMDSIAPLFAAIIFSKLFNATMDTHPGVSLLLMTAILIVPLFINIWIHFKTVLPDVNKNNALKDLENNGYNNKFNEDTTM